MSVPFIELGSKFIIGCGGALVTIYSRIGSDLPGMGKSYEIEDQKLRIKELNEKIDEYDKKMEEKRNAFENDQITVEEYNAIRCDIKGYRDAFSEERSLLRISVSDMTSRQNTVGTLSYLLLGGFFAALLTSGAVLDGSTLNTQTILAAVAMGAGWTGIIAKLDDVISKKDVEAYRTEISEKAVGKWLKAIDIEIKEKEKAIKGIVTLNKKISDKINSYKKILKTYEEKIDEYDLYVDEIVKTLKTMKDEGVFKPEHLSVLTELGLLEG